MKILNVVILTFLVVFSTYLGYNHGINVGMSYMADKIGKPLYMCVSLLLKKENMK